MLRGITSLWLLANKLVAAQFNQVVLYAVPEFLELIGMRMTHYFVTNNTLKSVASQFEHADKVSMDVIWQELLVDGLEQFLTRQEGVLLYNSKLLIESRFEVLVKEQSRFNSSEIFATKSPRFHSHAECEWMCKDYFNYEIPPQIAVLDAEVVREFQIYCQENIDEFKRLVQDGREDAFWARVEMKFRVKNIQPQQISRNNSGFHIISHADVEQLEEKIRADMAELRELELDEQYGWIATRFKFAPSFARAEKIMNMPDKDRQELFLLRKLFDYKDSLKSKLAALFCKQAGLEVGMLPEEALIQAGIEPCRACFG